jgi:hypothetical protein
MMLFNSPSKIISSFLWREKCKCDANYEDPSVTLKVPQGWGKERLNLKLLCSSLPSQRLILERYFPFQTNVDVL